jgi:hypothetical protein
MRPVFVVGLFGIALSVGAARAQDSSSSAASRKNRPSTAMDSLFENGPERPGALAEVQRQDAERKAKAEAQKPAGSEPPADKPPASPAPAGPSVQAVPPGPPQKNLNGEEFRRLHVGSSAKDVLAVLGPPSSRIVVPDDDGHLRETLQYFVKGAPLGTVRLDNGRVIQIETRAN